MPGKGGDGLTGVADRLARLVSLAGSQARAASLAGVSLSQFKRYLSAESQPGLQAMVALSRALDVRLDWLALGQGPLRTAGNSPPPLEESLMELVIVETERFLQRRQLHIDPARKGALLMAVYRLALRARDGGADPASVLGADSLQDLIGLAG
ncbi:hypothetical protein JCM17960_33440 [Magnetospira thiophila]